MKRLLECTCGFKTVSKYAYLRHKRLRHVSTRKICEKFIECPFCVKIFKFYFKFRKHLLKCSCKKNIFECTICGKKFTRLGSIKIHMLNCANQFGYGRNLRLPKLPKDSDIKLSKRAFQSYLQQYLIIPKQHIYDCEQFFSIYSKQIISLVNSLIEKLVGIKIQFCMQVTFSRDLSDVKTYQIAYFCTENSIVSSYYDLNKLYKVVNAIEIKIQDFQERGSNWKLEKIDKLDIKIGEYNSIYGGCFTSVPDKLFYKQAIINIKSHDQKCFLYCILVHLFPPKKSWQRARSQYLKKHEKKINTSNLKYPVCLNMISKFEKNNKQFDIKINVYGWSKLIDKSGHVVPIQISKSNGKNTINLLLINQHFYYIKNFNRLLGSINSPNHKFCDTCMLSFRTEKSLQNHKILCDTFQPSLSVLPNKNNNDLCFSNVKQMMEHPYIIYCDFETILVKVEKQISSKSKSYQEHKPCGFCIIIVNFNNKVIYQNVYRGSDAAKKFLFDLKHQSEKLIKKQLTNKTMIPLTNEQEKQFQDALFCHICKTPFDNVGKNGFIEFKVKDHCHITGNYRGAAHNSCNINFSMPNRIPVIFHNLKGYDSHIIIDAITSDTFSTCKLIPQTFEKYIAIILENLKILDSYQFMPESLQNLTENLKNGNHNFPITKQIFSQKNLTESDFDLLLQKQIYPYDYIDCFEKFEEPNLPKKNFFYNLLRFEEISNENYNHAKQIWNLFNLKNLGDFHDLYVLLDTSLLADVFQMFRKTILLRYGLDPCHFIVHLDWHGLLH